MSSAVDYDQVAPSYDSRYVERDYAGIEKTLRAFSKDSKRVLEVGCGTGHWLNLLSRGRQAVGVDPSGRMLGRARSLGRASLVRGRAESVPLADRSFDLVVVVNALHHFSDKARFALEAMRVLEPGGRVVILGLDPSAGLDSWFVYENFAGVLEIDRARYPSSSAISHSLTAAGFDDIATIEAQHIVESRSARDYLESGALTRHSTSQLSLLNDDEFEAGINRIWRRTESWEARGETLELHADLRIYATSGRRSTIGQ